MDSSRELAGSLHVDRAVARLPIRSVPRLATRPGCRARISVSERPDVEDHADDRQQPSASSSTATISVQRERDSWLWPWIEPRLDHLHGARCAAPSMNCR